LASEPDASFAHLLDVLAGRPVSVSGLTSHSGAVEASGPLLAANLCVLTHLVGTRSLPSLRGAVLVLEEVGERPYRIDRMLTQLISAGVLDGVAAVVVGHLSDCDEKPGGASGRDQAPRPLDVFRERLTDRCVLVTGAPVGHVAPNLALPLGAMARLSGTGESVRLDVAASGMA
jgi:muramoyltetrapeptide carboxypeptidase